MKHIRRIHVDKSFKWKRVTPSNQPAIKGFLKQPTDRDDFPGLDPPPPSQDEEEIRAGTKRHNSGEPKYPGAARQVTSDDKGPTNEYDTHYGNTEEISNDDFQLNQADIETIDKDSNNNHDENNIVPGIVADLREVGDSFLSIKSGFERSVDVESIANCLGEHLKSIVNI